MDDDVTCVIYRFSRGNVFKKSIRFKETSWLHFYVSRSHAANLSNTFSGLHTQVVVVDCENDGLLEASHTRRSRRL